MDIKEAVDAWKSAQARIAEQEKEIARRRSDLSALSTTNDDKVVASFMDAYRMIPRQIRMKIRNAINKDVTASREPSVNTLMAGDDA